MLVIYYLKYSIQVNMSCQIYPFSRYEINEEILTFYYVI